MTIFAYNIRGKMNDKGAVILTLKSEVLNRWFNRKRFNATRMLFQVF